MGFPDLPHIQRGCTNQSVTKKKQRWQNKDNGKHTHHCASCHQHTHGADDVDIRVKRHAEGRGKQAHAGYDDGRNGRGNSILLSSVLLVMLFADMPFLSSGTPFYLVRTSRRVWITGQVIYTIAATAVYLLFILGSTILLCMRLSFPANMWSPTAAILGYTNAGERLAVPALVKTLEMSWLYPAMATIFALMLGYTLVMVLIMLVCNLRFGQAAGVVGVLVFSLYGILMKPDTIQMLLKLPDEAYYLANVTIGWLSPLNHATYHMHNFGYDKLPRLWQSGIIFAVLIVLLYSAAVRAAKRYNFTFTGTEG